MYIETEAHTYSFTEKQFIFKNLDMQAFKAKALSSLQDNCHIKFPIKTKHTKHFSHLTQRKILYCKTAN